MTVMALEVCAECGVEPCPVIEALGCEIRLPFCPSCSVIVAAREDEAARDRALSEALSRAGQTPRLAGQTLASHPDSVATNVAWDWIEGLESGGARNLWLSGPVGTGKTGLAWGIVATLTAAAVDAYWGIAEDDRTVETPAAALMIRWADLLDDLKAAFDADRRAQTGGETADPSALLERAKRIPVLALDDLGRERPTPYAIEKLANLVESRYQRMLPTIVTSNYGTGELGRRLGHENAVDGARIVSRLIEGATGHTFAGESLRRRA